MGFYHKKNAWLHILDGATFFIGTSLCSFTVIIPSYVSRYTSNAFLLALVPFLLEFGMYGMQPVTTFLFKNSGSRNTIKIYFWTEFIHRLSFVAIALSIFLFGHNKNLALASFFIFWAASNISWGMAIPHWVDTLSITVPDKVRAVFLGQRELISRLSGVLASLSIPFILSLGVFPYNYGYLFLISGLLFSSGALFFRKFEPLYPFKERNQGISGSFSQFLKTGFRRLFRHKRLLPYLYAIWALTISRLTYAYFTPYIMKNILPQYGPEHLDSLVSILNTTLLIFTAFAAFLTGKVIHHLGHRIAIIMGVISIICANVLVLGWHSLAAAVLANLFLALFMGNTYMVSINVIMDFSHAAERSRTTAFNNVINIVFILGFGIIGSLIADHWGYGAALWLVVVIMMAILVAVIFSKRLSHRNREPA